MTTTNTIPSVPPLQIFGNNMFLLVLVSLVQMVWEAYFFISRLYRGPDLDPWRTDGLRGARNVLFLALASKRLLHLTGLVREFFKVAERADEALIDVEV